MTLLEFFTEGLVTHYIKTNGLSMVSGKGLAISIPAIFLILAVSYFFGSINFAIIISNRKYNQDIRSFGSNNAGMTNMVRTYGKKMGALTLVGDSLKAVISCLFGYAILGNHGAYLAAIACVLGHMFPVFFGFKGGKGVATAGFAMLMTNPYVFLICLVLFVLIVLMSKFVSLGSVMTMLIYPFILYGVDNFVLGGCPYVAYALIIAVLVIFKHKDNIKRLREGTERKFSLKSSKKESDAEPKDNGSKSKKK